MKEIVKFKHPDLSEGVFKSAANVKLEEVKEDGIAPENFHALSIYPEYFKVNNKWLLATNSRMDTVCVVDDTLGSEKLYIKEFRNLKKKDKVVIGRTEDASEGIYVYTEGFLNESEDKETFAFRDSRSRETAYSKDYDDLYDLLRFERENNGYVTVVLGMTLLTDKRSQKSLTELINKGYIDAIFAGTDTVALDLLQSSEENLDINDSNLIRVINKVNNYGSIKEYISNEKLCNSFVKACYENNVNLVIPGTIRDIYPLPETINNVYAAQDIMRQNQMKTTSVIMLGSILYSIATGNMTPSYNEFDESIRPIYIYTVDIQEFAVNKLADRGSLTAVSIVTNVKDFIENVNNSL